MESTAPLKATFKKNFHANISKIALKFIGTLYFLDISLVVEQAATTVSQFIDLLSKVRGALLQVGRRTMCKSSGSNDEVV